MSIRVANTIAASANRMKTLAVFFLVLSLIQAMGTFASVNGVYVYDVSPQSAPTTGGTKVSQKHSTGGEFDFLGLGSVSRLSSCVSILTIFLFSCFSLQLLRLLSR